MDPAIAGRPHMRVIGLAFLVVVVLMPLSLQGGAWTVLLLVQLAAAALALVAALRLRAVGRRG